jgi:SNW domain-containing protein 1
MRKNKVDRDEGRDISEKIALGMLKGTGGKLTGETMYDSRLFNQSSGMDAGFGGEDEYNTYSKPLFDRAEAASIYRPQQSAEDMYGDADTQMKQLSDTSRFKADKGFKGAEQSVSGGKRDAPVQFERAGAPSNSSSNHHSDDRHSQDRKAATEDPFGINDIVGNDRKKSRRD